MKIYRNLKDLVTAYEVEYNKILLHLKTKVLFFDTETNSFNILNYQYTKSGLIFLNIVEYQDMKQAEKEMFKLMQVVMPEFMMKQIKC